MQRDEGTMEREYMMVEDCAERPLIRFSKTHPST